MVSRTVRTPFGDWWWTVDRAVLAAMFGLMLGGIILSLAKQEAPDTSNYHDKEIVYRVKKRHHAGLIVRAKTLARVNELLGDYSKRFVDDFVAVMAPPERPE